MWEDRGSGHWTKDISGPDGRVALEIKRMAGGLKYQWSGWSYDAAGRSTGYLVGMTKSRERAEQMIDKALRRAAKAR